MILTIMLSLAAQDPGPASGDWLDIGQEAGISIAVDEASTSREGDVVTLRFRAQMGQGPAGWEIVRATFDCRTELLRLLDILEYGADGALLVRRGPEPPRRPLDHRMAPLRAACHRTGWGEAEAAQ